MADLSYPATPVPTSGVVQGRGIVGYLGLSAVPVNGRLQRNFLHLTPTGGVISDRVVLLAAGIEIPFANGRVWLLRLADGYKAWEGWSDAAGGYTATGLELGVAYIPVAIDPSGVQKATAAGPVIAQ